MQVLLGAGAMAEDDLLSKLQECIELHQDAARRAKLKFVDNKEQDKATLDSVISVLNTQLDPLGLKVRRARNCRARARGCEDRSALRTKTTPRRAPRQRPVTARAT